MLSQAIFTVNRHAKTATNPKFLYTLKKQAILKMIKEGKASKVGLHFSQNPKFSNQQSDVLVKCGEYTFHIPPSKEDFKSLRHLGKLNQTTRNPKCRMNLTEAKRILQKYTGTIEKKLTNHNNQKAYKKPVFKKLGDSFF
ncbi:YkyB family protein [Bacillus spongiae]|uniref:YkyB family protein n=1 Tax=Bacillus spongiae TaxID=2683610 RepID=A0ABU8H9F2_9BACI